MTIQLCKTCIQKGSRWPRIDLKQTQRDSYIPSLFLKIYSDRCFIEFFTAGMFIHVFINAKFKFCSLTINFLKKTTTSFYIVILKQTNKQKTSMWERWDTIIQIFTLFHSLFYVLSTCWPHGKSYQLAQISVSDTSFWVMSVTRNQK